MWVEFILYSGVRKAHVRPRRRETLSVTIDRAARACFGPRIRFAGKWTGPRSVQREKVRDAGFGGTITRDGLIVDGLFGLDTSCQVVVDGVPLGREETCG